MSGATRDLLVAHGATSVLAETPEVCGAEHLLTRRAVSREAGRPYHDKLLPLPPFMLSSQGGLAEGDVKAGLDITGHFLEQFVFGPLNRPLPPARLAALKQKLEANRLTTPLFDSTRFTRNLEVAYETMRDNFLKR